MARVYFVQSTTFIGFMLSICASKKFVRLMLASAVLAASLLVAAGCSKDSNKVYNASFYSIKAADGPLSLYIDGVYKGQMPCHDTPLVCSAPGNDGGTPLTMQVPCGEYKLEARDTNGHTISSCKARFRKNGAGASSTGPGGNWMSIQDDCLLVGFWQ